MCMWLKYIWGSSCSTLHSRAGDSSSVGLCHNNKRRLLHPTLSLSLSISPQWLLQPIWMEMCHRGLILESHKRMRVPASMSWKQKGKKEGQRAFRERDMQSVCAHIVELSIGLCRLWSWTVTPIVSVPPNPITDMKTDWAVPQHVSIQDRCVVFVIVYDIQKAAVLIWSRCKGTCHTGLQASSFRDGEYMCVCLCVCLCVCVKQKKWKNEKNEKKKEKKKKERGKKEIYRDM